MDDEIKEEPEKEFEGIFRTIGKHVWRNKDRYGCALIGAGVATLVLSRGNKQVIVNAFQWKPIIENVQLTMPYGHYRTAVAIRCVETGEKFASMARAAKANGSNVGDLSRHLAGETNHVKGLHFEKA